MKASLGKKAGAEGFLIRAKSRIMAECSRKEISAAQAHKKLLDWLSESFQGEDLLQKTEDIVSYLEREKYIDDSRYAKAFTRDKLRFSKWGPEKILKALIDAGVEKSIAGEAVYGEEELAGKVLEELIAKKREELEKKIARKTAQYKEQVAELEELLKDADNHDSEPQYGTNGRAALQKEKAALLRKIYSLKMKIKTSDMQIKTSLTVFARQRGFSVSSISKLL